MAALKIKKVTYDFGQYTVVLDERGHAWVNGQYVCQFSQVAFNAEKAKIAIAKHIEKTKR